jgi:anti-sigma factor RsiW
MDRGHDALRVSLGALALGMLDADERRAVLQHADECLECSAELDDFLELAALLRPAAAPDLDPALTREPEPMV